MDDRPFLAINIYGRWVIYISSAAHVGDKHFKKLSNGVVHIRDKVVLNVSL